MKIEFKTERVENADATRVSCSIIGLDGFGARRSEVISRVDIEEYEEDQIQRRLLYNALIDFGIFPATPQEIVSIVQRTAEKARAEAEGALDTVNSQGLPVHNIIAAQAVALAMNGLEKEVERKLHR